LEIREDFFTSRPAFAHVTSANTRSRFFLEEHRIARFPFLANKAEMARR
jgi:hypothetical protein